MSHTYRKDSYRWFRRPKTQQERKQINSILDDIQHNEYRVSGVNHLQRRLLNLPTSWDDIIVSACFEKPTNS
jgi:hypothetical protein